MNGLKDKVAFVTGAGSGIGRQTALRLAREGVKVAIVDLNLDSARSVVDEVASLAGEAIAVQSDVTSAEQVKKAADRVDAELGGADFLVNCAGVALGEGGVVQCDESAWDKTMNINVKSIYLTGKYVIPHMLAKGGGSVVSIASVFGETANPDECAYAASKGAVLNLSRQIAIQHAKDGIRSNSILPSDCDTPLISKLLGVTGEELITAKADLAAPIPMGRLAQPEEIASGITFLLSDDAKFITGVALPVDGGFLAR